MSTRWYAPGPTVMAPRTPIRELGAVLGSLGDCCCYFGSSCFTCVSTMPIDVGQTPAGITDPYGGSATEPCQFIQDNGEITGINQEVGDTGATVGELRAAGYSDGQISDMLEAYNDQQAAVAPGSTVSTSSGGNNFSPPGGGKSGGGGGSSPQLPKISLPTVPKPSPTVSTASLFGSNPLGFLTQASIAGIPNWILIGGVLLFAATGGSGSGRKR